MDTKYIHHIHPLSPFPCAHPTSHWYPRQEKTYFSFLLFICFKYMLIVQGDFCLGTSGLYVLCFNQMLNPLLLTHSLLPCSPNIQQLTLHSIDI
jgi:hypothetical protein